MKKAGIVLLLLFWSCGTSFLLAQQASIEKAVEPAFSGAYTDAISGLKKLDTVGMPMEDRALWNFYLGYTYNLNDQQDLAYQHMLLAKQFYTDLERPNDVKDCNLQLLSILSHQNRIDKKTKPILEELDRYLSDRDTSIPAVRFKVYRELGSNYLGALLPEKALETFQQSYSLSQEIQDSTQMSFDLMNIGSSYKVLKQYDSALVYTKRGLPYLLRKNDSLNISYNYNNQAEAYKFLGQYEEALAYYLRSDSMLPVQNRLKSRVSLYDNLVDLYEQTGAFEQAYQYSKRRKILIDSIDDRAQNLAIEEYRTKYETAETEKNLLVAQQEKRRNRDLAILLGIGLLIAVLVTYLMIKNARRKQLLAEQDKLIEIQNKEKILKQQELVAIDSMIEGQEKERQRIASDLHDSIGGTLAAAKLQFEHLRNTQEKKVAEEPLFQATGQLLEQAYQEIRGMSHLKHHGVMAQKGLLPAVEKLAKTISIHREMEVNVHHHGLTEKLEASLEIAIFRTIQELLTNVLKHAQATEVTISITQHETSLNIMVEDDGIGFEPRQVLNREGVGLASIEKRIEHLEGNMEVDSSPGNGTSIIIDIPT